MPDLIGHVLAVFQHFYGSCFNVQWSTTLLQTPVIKGQYHKLFKKIKSVQFNTCLPLYLSFHCQ